MNVLALGGVSALLVRADRTVHKGDLTGIVRARKLAEATMPGAVASPITLPL